MAARLQQRIRVETRTYHGGRIFRPCKMTDEAAGADLVDARAMTSAAGAGVITAIVTVISVLRSEIFHATDRMAPVIARMAATGRLAAGRTAEIDRTGAIDPTRAIVAERGPQPLVLGRPMTTAAWPSSSTRAGCRCSSSSPANPACGPVSSSRTGSKNDWMPSDPAANQPDPMQRPPLHPRSAHCRSGSTSSPDASMV
jgi:hypothetical protein